MFDQITSLTYDRVDIFENFNPYFDKTNQKNCFNLFQFHIPIETDNVVSYGFKVYPETIIDIVMMLQYLLL